MPPQTVSSRHFCARTTADLRDYTVCCVGITQVLGSPKTSTIRLELISLAFRLGLSFGAQFRTTVMFLR